MLLIVSIVLWCVWLEFGGVVLKYLVGYLFGEYSVLVVVGSLSLGDVVKLVNLCGKLM